MMGPWNLVHQRPCRIPRIVIGRRRVGFVTTWRRTSFGWAGRAIWLALITSALCLTDAAGADKGQVRIAVSADHCLSIGLSLAKSFASAARVPVSVGDPYPSSMLREGVPVHGEDVFITSETVGSEAAKHGERIAKARGESVTFERHIIGQIRPIVIAPQQSRISAMSRDSLRGLIARGAELPAEMKQLYDKATIHLDDTPTLRRCVQWTTMTWEDDTGAGLYFYRKSIEKHKDVEELRKAMLRSPDSIGIVQWRPNLALTGLKTVAIGPKGKEVRPGLTAAFDKTYPLAENLVLYCRKDSPGSVDAFRQFCLSEAGADVLSTFHVTTPWHEWHYLSDQRIEAMKQDKGDPLSVAGAKVADEMLGKLATEYVRVKQVVHLRYQGANNPNAALASFATGSGRYELMVLEEKPDLRTIERLGDRWTALGENQLGPTEHLLAGRATAIVVHASNELNALTLDQVRSIYTGELADWSVIGGTGLKSRGGGESVRMHALGIGVGDPSAQLFREQCLKGETPASTVDIKKDTAEAVAAVSVDPQAIAFVDWASIPEDGQTVKVLAILVGQGERAKPIEPSAQTIKNAMYPLSQRIYMYVHPDASDAAKGFAEFLATGGESAMSPYRDSVQAVMDTFRKHGLVSLSEAATKRRIESQLKAAQAEHDRKSKGK